MSNLINVNEDNFETEVLSSNLLVLVDFSATWCFPCKKQLPILEQFALANLGKIKVCKIDVDESPAIASKFGIKSVPNLLFFKEGKNVASRAGLTTLSALNDLLNELNS